VTLRCDGGQVAHLAAPMVQFIEPTASVSGTAGRMTITARLVRRDTRSREHDVTTGDDISDIAHEIVSWLKGRSRPRPTS
jgi:hypothetical protein